LAWRNAPDQLPRFGVLVLVLGHLVALRYVIPQHRRSVSAWAIEYVKALIAPLVIE